ncbi:MAG TPA: tetratricopeptide repeat protein [Candidatus Edwardsbacteria bacterium]|nr:tetratricopeptide repeat protein [Candidatus Edwardsbacteria bacterium]
MLCALIIVVVTAASYVGAMAGQLLWDDYTYLQDDPAITALDAPHLAMMFDRPFFSNYQPLTLLSYAVDRAVGGTRPRAYHATNLLLHIANVLLVFWLLRSLTGRSLGALCGALLFAVHPAHVESVAWISGRKDLLYSLFLLGAMIAYLKHIRSCCGRRWYWLSLSLAVMSALSKGQAMVLPGLLLLLDWFVGNRPLRRALADIVPFALVAAGTAGLALWAARQVIATGMAAGLGAGDRLGLALFSLLRYGAIAVWPARLSAFYPYPLDGQLRLYPQIIVIALAGTMAAGAVVWLLRDRRSLLLGAGIFCGSLLPMLQLVPAGGAVIADRYLYLALLGPCLIAGAMIDHWRRRAHGAAARMAPLASAAVLVMVLGSLAHARCRVWHDGLSLFGDVSRRHPAAAISYMNIGVELAIRGDERAAIPYFKQAIALDPNYFDSYRMLAGIAYRRGDTDAALRYGARALALRPNAAWTQYHMGSTLLLADQPGRALPFLTRAVALDPARVEARLDRSIALSLTHDQTAALAELDTILMGNPDDSIAIGDRAVVLLKLDRYRDAIAATDVLVQRHPGYLLAYKVRARALLRAGQTDRAATDLEWYLAQRPGDREADAMRRRLRRGRTIVSSPERR